VTREELKTKLEALGATVQGSVTKKTDILIVGAERGEIKYNTALKYGVTILPWPMAKALGLLEERPGSTLDRETTSLVRDVVFQMVRLVDNIYAHCITGELGLFRSFDLGCEAIESLLQAAWGAELNGDSSGCEDPDEDSYERIGRCLRECLSYWRELVNEMAIVNSVSDSM